MPDEKVDYSQFETAYYKTPEGHVQCHSSGRQAPPEGSKKISEAEAEKLMGKAEQDCQGAVDKASKRVRSIEKVMADKGVSAVEAAKKVDKKR